MSYEGEMLKKLNMPSKEKVELALLRTLFNHNGVIREFGTGEEIVEEIADSFNLNKEQRNTYLETIYRKENRLKKSNLWHRLLFRAADDLAKQKLVSRPTITYQLTNRKEWMLTEKGYDRALILIGIPSLVKEKLSIKSFEVEKLAKKIKLKQKPIDYDPINLRKPKSQSTRTLSLRNRSFRQVIIETYEFKCAVCGLKIHSPKNFQWEVEAAHIVPHSFNGKDDVWNGLSLCRFHHWAFDVGWYSFDQEFQIVSSEFLKDLPTEMGKMWGHDFVRLLVNQKIRIQLPKNKELWPDMRAIQWHREKILKGL